MDYVTRSPRTSPDPKDEYWTVRDVAAYLGLAPLTVIQYHQERRIPYRDRRSTTLLWRPARIIAWRPDPQPGGPRDPAGMWPPPISGTDRDASPPLT